MNSEIFDIVVMVTRIVLSLIGVLVVPKLMAYLQANTTEKQRVEAEYWTKKAILIAEIMFKDKPSSGFIKKENVIEWLNKNNIALTTGQADILIDLIVEEWNAKGWPYGGNMQRLK